MGDHFITSLPRPGGNTTGFIYVEGAMAGKWLGLLMEIAPHVKRVACIFNPDTTSGRGTCFLPSFETAAQLLKVEPVIAPVQSEADIEKAISSLAREPGGGLITLADTFMLAHRALITSLMAKNSMPAVYYETSFARDGGLLCYGPDQVDMFHRAAVYVDRILRGEKPGELPAQVPSKFILILNVRTAKALGLAFPERLLATADEVIQ